MSYSTDERWIAQVNNALEWVYIGKQAQYDIPLTADFTTPGLDVLNFDLGAFEVFWTGIDALDGQINLEWSISGNHWSPLGGDLGKVNLVQTPGCVGFDLAGNIAYKYVRLRYVHGAGTTGTLTIRSLLKTRL